MRPRFEILAITAIGLAGCGKGNEISSNNLAVENPTPSGNHAAPNVSPDTNSSGAKVAANSAPESNNAPIANNTPSKSEIVSTKPETIDGKVPPMKPVLASQAGGWSKDAQAARDLASKVDASTKKLTDSKIHFFEGARLVEGHGHVESDLIIADQKRYLLNYAKFETQGRPHFETYLVRKMPDGTYATLVGGKYVPGRVSPTGDIVGGWFTDCTHYIASGIGTGQKPLTDLIDAAQKAKWKISVETKSFDNGTFKRIVMDSPTQPRRRYELTIEPKKLLLTNFNADINDNKRNQVSVTFQTMKSDRPLTEKDLKPEVPTEKITVLTPEEAKKQGIKVPEPKKRADPPKN